MNEIFTFWDQKDELLEKYNEIWDNVNSVIEKAFDTRPVLKENIWKLN